jgi:hypothetical protein
VLEPLGIQAVLLAPESQPDVRVRVAAGLELDGFVLRKRF